MKGTRIQQMFRQVVTLVFMVCRLWRPIPGGATAREHPAPNPRNGPFRPTPAASSARDSPASSWTSSSKPKKDFMFKDALFDSSSRTRSRSPRPSMSRRSATLPQQDISVSRLQSGTLSRRWTSSTRPNSTTPTGANLSTPDITGSRILADITAKHIVRLADITGGYNWCLFLWHCPV